MCPYFLQQKYCKFRECIGGPRPWAEKATDVSKKSQESVLEELEYLFFTN